MQPQHGGPPDQAGTAAGSLRFVMSVRGIGEGHRSSIGFRTGVVDAAGGVTIDEPAPFATVGAVVPTLLDGAVFRSELARLDEPARPPTTSSMRSATASPEPTSTNNSTSSDPPEHPWPCTETISLIRAIAERTYGVEFADDIPLSERVLWPAMGAEAAGMEDARFVRFVDDDGSVTFYATYTAYSGSHISQQLLETTDFRSFTSTPMVGTRRGQQGPGAVSPPDRGRFAAMSRSDRESNSIAYSDHPFVWPSSVPCQRPTRAWEALQLGNCGRPSRPRPGGWCSPTASVRCAPTASGRSCSISTIRPGFSVSSGSRC